MLKHKDLIQLHDQVNEYFMGKWTLAEKYEQLKKAKHWTPAEIESIKNQHRDPFSFPIITSKINNIVATQRSARSEWKVLPTFDPADEAKAAMATVVLKQKEKVCNFKYIESEVFDAGLSVNCGAVEVYKQPTSYGDSVMLRQLDHRDVVWDVNARQYDLSDALFICKVERMYRIDVKKIYGEQYSKGGGNLPLFGRPKADYFISTSNYGADYDIISIFTHYQKVLRNYYCVVFPDHENRSGSGGNELIGMYRTKKEAENILNDLRKLYVLEEESTMGEVVKIQRSGIDKYVFNYKEIISQEETMDEHFPIVVYRAFHFSNDYWTLTDILYDSQRFFDKLYAQIDYSLGRDVKNVFEGNALLLADGETAETATRKMNKGGEIIWKRGDGVMFNPMKQQGINPQYIQIAQVMQSFLEDLAGGRSFQGLSEGANESGRAVIAKQRQGMLVANMFLDNLARWKQTVGERLLQYAGKYESADVTIKFSGNEIPEAMFRLLQSQDIYIPSMIEKDSGFLKLPTGLKFLQDMSYELTVSSAELNENIKNAKFMQLLSLQQVFPNAIPIDIFLEYFDIPFDVKEKIKTRAEEERKRQQMMQEFQMLNGGSANPDPNGQRATVANVYNETQQAINPESKIN